jgi:hypothetical protein
MTEYTKADYLAAHEALWDGKPTEYRAAACLGEFSPFWSFTPPSADDAKEIQWRPVDPLREYKDALAAGKRVEWQHEVGLWYDVIKYGLIIGGDPSRFRIVEPKTVKLFPFAYKDGDLWRQAGFYTDIETAKRDFSDGTKLVRLNQDGSIEVES